MPAATLERTRYNGVDAYRLSDGQTEAIVVPEYSGRVMSYRRIGGEKLLWNAPPENLAKSEAHQ